MLSIGKVIHSLIVTKHVSFEILHAVLVTIRIVNESTASANVSSKFTTIFFVPSEDFVQSKEPEAKDTPFVSATQLIKKGASRVAPLRVTGMRATPPAAKAVVLLRVTIGNRLKEKPLP